MQSFKKLTARITLYLKIFSIGVGSSLKDFYLIN